MIKQLELTWGQNSFYTSTFSCPQLSFHELILKFSYNMYILIRIISESEFEWTFRINWNPWPVTVAFVSHCPLVLYFPVFVIRIWAFCLPQKNIFFNATTTPLANLLCSLRHIVCTPRASPPLETVQDFLCKLCMKPHVHLVEISIFSLNDVIVRPTKIIKQADY